MLKLGDVQGAIFDVDETLLDIGMADHTNSLHARSRLQALREAGERHNLPSLLSITPEENKQGFQDAPVHTLEGGIWHILFTCGVVSSDTLDLTNPLLKEIAARKDELYEPLLRREGKPILGAVDFVAWLASQKFGQRLAIATTAPRRHVAIFFENAGLDSYFPSERIVAKEDVNRHKPDPEVFEKAFQTLDLPEIARNQVLAFEDNPRGIQSAKGANLYTCAITSHVPANELARQAVPPDLIADSYAEFRRLLTA